MVAAEKAVLTLYAAVLVVVMVFMVVMAVAH